MDFYSAYSNRPFGQPEPVEYKPNLDTLGYRSVKDQVESFMVAGVRIDAFRSGYYDSDFLGQGESIEDLNVPLYRQPYTDFADVQRAVNDFSDLYKRRVSEAAAAGRAPQNAPILNSAFQQSSEETAS